MTVVLNLVVAGVAIAEGINKSTSATSRQRLGRAVLAVQFPTATRKLTSSGLLLAQCAGSDILRSLCGLTPTVLASASLMPGVALN
eukprot:COSAG02_NODE_1254_length_13584_cov_15.001483_3_plen_86_part_00